MEKEIYFAWYRLRGLGLLCLCSFVFFFGAYLANQRSLAVSGGAGAQILPVSHVQREDGRLALSFDLAKGSGSVRMILDILEKYHAKATFFVTKTWAETHQEEVREIAEAGHDLGSRGADRRSMAGQPREEISAELKGVRDTLRDLTGISVNLFRAPYGEYDVTLLGVLNAEGYVPVRWNIDSEDWKDYGVESVLQKVLESEELSAGSIVRLHGGAEYTGQALEALVAGLQEKGYELAAVSQLLS